MAAQAVAGARIGEQSNETCRMELAKIAPRPKACRLAGQKRLGAASSRHPSGQLDPARLDSTRRELQRHKLRSGFEAAQGQQVVLFALI